jgi:RNA polymerase sigma-70 factor (ECF subfamily)
VADRTDPRTLVDEDLMELVREGHAEAFELIYERHGTAAFWLAYRMTGPGGSRQPTSAPIVGATLT